MSGPSSGACIYRVPELLIRRKPEAYRPGFVSFGPFHHNKHLGAMEDHKLEALRKTLARVNNNGKSIEDLIVEVQMSEEEIRKCYGGRAIEYEKKTLAWMMTMDGCFILEFLRAVYAEPENRGFSLIFNKGKIDSIIQCGILNDILKLENQIPLFILTKILELELATYDNAVVKLSEILYKCLVFHYYPFKTNKNNVQILDQCKSYLLGSPRPCHLLDLCRKMIEDILIQTTNESCPESTFRCDLSTCLGSLSFMNVCRGRRGQRQRMAEVRHVYEIPRAELLHNAGIQFKLCEEGHVRFEKRCLGSSTLFLPRIVVEENRTETKLRNLIIFEEYEKTKGKDNVISNYISFMNRLIDSEKDVALLTKEGIIINWLGSDEEVAALFNNLDKETVIGGVKQFLQVARQVREEYDKKLKVLMNQFIEEHCSKPWYIVSLVAAILILVMTAIQTVYSVKK